MPDTLLLQRPHLIDQCHKNSQNDIVILTDGVIERFVVLLFFPLITQKIGFY